jgi:VWFA-related protein
MAPGVRPTDRSAGDVDRLKITETRLIVKCRPSVIATALLAITTAVSGQGLDRTSANAQDEPIRLKTELIEVRAVVARSGGEVVAGLKKEDFEVLENGRPQQVAFFAVERVDSPAGSPPGMPPVVPGLPTRAGEAAGRTLVFFVDTIHLSLSGLPLIRQALRRFVEEQLTERDIVWLVTSTGSLGLLEQPTRDRRMIFYGIDRLRPGLVGPESLFTPYLASMVVRGDADALRLGTQIMSLEGAPAWTLRDVEAKARDVLVEATYKRGLTLGTLRAVTERLRQLSGQRLILFMSDGFSLMGNGGSFDTGDLNQITSLAARSGLIFYSLDARGLETSSWIDASRRMPVTNRSFYSFMSASRADLENAPNALAADTGGRFISNTNDLGIGIRKALDENSQQYVIAYYPVEESDKNTFRRITLKVKGHPEYSIRSPKGYLPADSTSSEKTGKVSTPEQKLIQAIAAPLPATAIQVTAQAAYFETASDPAQVSLSVHIDGGELNYRNSDKLHRVHLELVTIVFDHWGKAIQTHKEVIEGDLTDQRLQLARRDGYAYVRRLTLKPGLYQARVGVFEPSSGNTGTAMTLVEVPNLRRSGMTMSNILLAATLPEGMRPGKDDESERPQSRILQGIRVFKKGSELVYHFIVYNAQASGGRGALVLQSEITAAGRSVYRSDWQPLETRAVGRDSKGVETAGHIAMELEPGVYELRITVKEENKDRTVTQSVLFGVEP